MSSSLDFFGSTKVDSSISTGTVPRQLSGDVISDEATVRNAVTSADLARFGSEPLPWANTSTGSAGVVNMIYENRKAGRICRTFKTTRHSYQGIANFTGEACLLNNGEWHLTRFDQN